MLRNEGGILKKFYTADRELGGVRHRAGGIARHASVVARVGPRHAAHGHYAGVRVEPDHVDLRGLRRCYWCLIFEPRDVQWQVTAVDVARDLNAGFFFYCRENKERDIWRY